MTSVTGKKRGRGFTLFELLIVLGIIALFTGFFFLRFDDGVTEEALTEASTRIRGAALKAKKRAYAFRRDQYIVFTRGGFILTESPPIDEGLIPLGGFADNERSYRETFAIPSGLTMEWLKAGETKWSREPGFYWIFRSSGLSDPLSVRFTRGRSYSRLDFNVLTGLAEEETFIE